VHRFAGLQVPRFAGAQVPRCPGGVQKCRSAKVQEGIVQQVQVKRCRGAEAAEAAEMQRCRGAEVLRC
jgi:hypothetical protein